MKYKRINQFCAETGYSPGAVRAKIRDGIWMPGREYRKAPDGHILIDTEGYESWVEQESMKAFAPVAKKASRSTSSIAESDAGKRSASPPPLRT